MGVIIKNYEELTLVVYGLRQLDSIVVQASGAFDYFHIGHVKYLQKAKDLGQYLFVTVNSDESVRRLKGKDRPFVCQQYRVEILAALSCVDFVYVFDEDLPNKSIEKIKPTIYVKGADYRDKFLPEQETIIRNGGMISFLDTIYDSSTKMMRALEKYVDNGGELNG